MGDSSIPTLPLSHSPALLLIPILVAYLGLAFGYALGTPRWNNPDEPAHFNYIAHLATQGQFPVMQMGDWDSDRLGRRLASGRFTTAEPIDELRYEGHQPPLYYLVMAPLYRATERLGANARVVALRAASIAMGAVVVCVVFAAGRVLAPERAEVAPLAAGVVALIPMHTAMTATINNDTMAELLASATLLAVLLGLKSGFGVRGALAVGMLSALLLLTKFTVYVLAPLAILALALESAAPRQVGEPPRLGRAVRLVVLASAVTLGLAGWWFARNVAVYGWPDSFGLIRHDQVVAGQPRWPGPGENLESVRFFAYSLFRSFWGQFGWMAVVLDAAFYWVFLLISALAATGVVAFWRRELPGWAPGRASGVRLLVAALGLVVLEVVVYNLSFIQAQGRYLYPAILPLGILLALGWSELARSAAGAGRRWAAGLGLATATLWWGLVDGLTWLLVGAAAPAMLRLVGVLPWVLVARSVPRWSAAVVAGWVSVGLVVALGVMNAAALLRFVVPYFAGW